MTTPNIVIAGFTGDRSGSMESTKGSAGEGLYDWIESQKKSIQDNSQIGKCLVSTFDNVREIKINAEKFNDINVTKEMCTEWMEPRGMTKLYDSAIADIDALVQIKEDFIKNMPRSLKNINPKIVIVWACMTDGADNSSINSITDFKNKVEWAKTHHDMKCFFLAANQDAVMTGSQYGFSPDYSLTFGANYQQTQNAMRSVTQVMREASQNANTPGFTQMMRSISAPTNNVNVDLAQTLTPNTMLRQPSVS